MVKASSVRLLSFGGQPNAAPSTKSIAPLARIRGRSRNHRDCCPIALGAEQLVETIHWRREISAERESLLQEAADSVTPVKARKAEQPCIDRQPSEIRVVLDRHHQRSPLGLNGAIGVPTRQGATRIVVRKSSTPSCGQTSMGFTKASVFLPA